MAVGSNLFSEEIQSSFIFGIALHEIPAAFALITLLKVAKIKKKYAHENLDLTDGVKIVRGHSWVHIRPSNTEPIIRVIAEAPTEAEANNLCAEIKGDF